jgi:hypothetical protein
MQFYNDLHQKVRYAGQLYVVILDEFPDFHQGDAHFEVVLHPISNDWIVHIKSQAVRNFLRVKKGDCTLVEHVVMA